MGFKLTHKLPETCLVAVSGGIDSMVALHWLSQVPGRVQGVVHMNHGTGLFADGAELLIRSRTYGMELHYRRLHEQADSGQSRENYWREQRYRFFEEVFATTGLPIVLAHNFDDCLEEYVMCTMVRGYFGTIPYQHGACIRPFRLWKRELIERYAKHHKLSWLEDPSNEDTKFKRCFIRHNIAPEIKELNPGVYNIVEKAIKEQDNEFMRP